MPDLLCFLVHNVQFIFDFSFILFLEPLLSMFQSFSHFCKSFADLCEFLLFEFLEVSLALLHATLQIAIFFMLVIDRIKQLLQICLHFLSCILISKYEVMLSMIHNTLSTYSLFIVSAKILNWFILMDFTAPACLHIIEVNLIL